MSKEETKKTEPKKGMKPVEQKYTRDWGNLEDEFNTNSFTLSPSLLSKLREAGLSHRFISPEERKKRYGTSFTQGWRPYKLDESDRMGVDQFLGGSDPDGYFRRGDQILVVRPKEATDYHNKLLREKSARQSKSEKVRALELQKQANASRISTQIVHGYGDDKE